VRMDPRAQRSRDRLTAAVLDLAGNGRLDDVSVSELAQLAGVTRDTFYRHTTSVTDLLASALTEKLEEFVRSYPTELPPLAELAEVLRRGELDLLQHIVDYSAVYRTAFGARNAAPVRRAVEGVIQAQIEIALRAYPALSPLGERDADDRAVHMVAAYAAAGTIAAVEVWLSSADPSDVASAVRIISAGAPRWWLVATGRI
jgi:AcrR family transcriptional regulator